MSTRRLIVAEPQAAYLHRPKLVVDASVICAVVYGEPSGEEAGGWLRGRTLCAPHLIDAEVINTGLNKLRRRNMKPQAIENALEWFQMLELERYPVSASAVLELAMKHALTAYDAMYLGLAISLDAPLATFDAKLGEAARKQLGGTAPGR